jgi:hypothetical protein
MKQHNIWVRFVVFMMVTTKIPPSRTRHRVILTNVSVKPAAYIFRVKWWAHFIEFAMRTQQFSTYRTAAFLNHKRNNRLSLKSLKKSVNWEINYRVYSRLSVLPTGNRRSNNWKTRIIAYGNSKMYEQLPIYSVTSKTVWLQENACFVFFPPYNFCSKCFSLR